MPFAAPGPVSRKPPVQCPTSRWSEAAARGALGEIEQLAWALYGSADTLAAFNLKELCARLDREARAGTIESATEAVQAIAREVGRVRSSLAADLKKRGLR
ncbi:hypothetical protein [Sorangium sp. So ce887]|uniref:hypothetical protein n=1 Tax=Sorangium sp. So ce887 TaxID=3133324 RepID=UPI003F5FB1D5